MSPLGSLSIYSYSRLSAAGLKCGFSTDAVLTSAGVEFDMKRRVGYDLTLANIIGLYTAAMAASTRAYFPLAMAENFSFDFLPEVEAFLSTSPTLESAAKIIDWLPALLVPEFQFSVMPKGSQIAFQVKIAGKNTDSAAMNGIIDTVVGSAVLFLRKLLPSDANFQIHLAHPAGASNSEYTGVLGQLPVFESDFSGLLIPYAELSRPIARDSARVNALTALAIEDTIRTMMCGKSVAEQVLKHLSRQVEATVDEVAHALEMPVRTLQRRLKAEDTSFQAQQNRALSNLATQYLANPLLDVETIALKLGFSDRHSFSRAFKRWTGETPSNWRQKQSAI